MSAERSSPRLSPAFWFLAPALSLILVFFLVPLAGALVLSFTDFDIYGLADPGQVRWVGLANYRQLLADARVWRAFANTGYFAVLGGVLSVLVSLAAALLLNHAALRGRALFRSALFLPVVTLLVAVAVVWRYLLHPRLGWLNGLLGWFGLGPIDWLGDPAWAMPSLILMSVWKNFGFNMVILLAGLQSIPASLHDAARLDGAGAWRRFTAITVPMLTPTLTFVSVMTLIGGFQLFAEPYVMTQGGPDEATLSVALLMFQEGFRWWNLGYASALAMILLLAIALATRLSLRLTRTDE